MRDRPSHPRIGPRPTRDRPVDATRFVIHPASSQEISADTKPRARAVAAITVGITPAAVALAVAKHLCASGLPGPLQDISPDFRETLNVVKGASPHSADSFECLTAVQSAPSDGGGALRVRGCMGHDDALRHYLHDFAVWQVAERRIGAPRSEDVRESLALRGGATDRARRLVVLFVVVGAPTAPSDRRSAGSKRSPRPREFLPKAGLV